MTSTTPTTPIPLFIKLLFGVVIFATLVSLCSSPQTAEEVAQEAKEKQERLAQKQAEQERREQERLAQAQAEQERKKKEEQACRNDLTCWSDRYKNDAQMACYPLIERYAKYDYEWESWYRPDFSKVAWNNKPGGILGDWGEDIKFQNGFGAWQRMTYWCIYNPTSKEASAAVYPR